MRITVVVACVLIACSAGARAAETDPYYAWWSPPRDGTDALNAVINDRLQRGLARVNATPATRRSCDDVARAMTLPLFTTAWWYFLSDMRSWDVDHVPRTSSEYAGAFDDVGTYRYAGLLPFGKLIPVDPAVRVGDVLFGTDKLGHFFTNGTRYLERYRAARKKGASVDEAERAAVALGVAQEKGWLGFGVSGVFSYGDLTANFAGLQFYKGLCPEPAAAPSPSSPSSAPAQVSASSSSARAPLRLVERDGVWSLSRPFDIAEIVDPCWDEAFFPSAFGSTEEAPVRRALGELCPRWQRRAVDERWRRYEARGCSARHRALLAPFRESGALPKPLSIDDVCGARAQN